MVERPPRRLGTVGDLLRGSASSAIMNGLTTVERGLTISNSTAGLSAALWEGKRESGLSASGKTS